MKPELEVERERTVVVLLRVDVRAARAVRSEPAQPVGQQRAPEAPALHGGRDREPLHVARDAGPPEQSVAVRITGASGATRVCARGVARVASRSARSSKRQNSSNAAASAASSDCAVGARRPPGRAGRRAEAARGRGRGGAVGRAPRSPTSTSGRLAPGPSALVTTSRYPSCWSRSRSRSHRSGRGRVGTVQRQGCDVGPAVPRRDAGDATTKSVRLRPVRLHRRRA